jgi:hypothetical protein
MPRKPKITKGPEEQLEFVEGDGWKACHDKKRELYTAESYVAGYYDLYEIGKDTYSRLKTERLDRRGAHELIGTGRHLYKSVSDRNGSYDIALDEDYASLCPWADVQKTVVALFVCVAGKLKLSEKILKMQPFISLAVTLLVIAAVFILERKFQSAEEIKAWMYS